MVGSFVWLTCGVVGGIELGFRGWSDAEVSPAGSAGAVRDERLVLRYSCGGVVQMCLDGYAGNEFVGLFLA